MGNFANQVQAFHANGVHFFNGAINYTNGDSDYDAGDVNVFSNGQQGSFCYSATNNTLFLSSTPGTAYTIRLTGPL